MKSKKQVILYSLVFSVIGTIISLFILIKFIPPKEIIIEKPVVQDAVFTGHKDLPVQSIDLTNAAEHSVDAVVHVKTETLVQSPYANDPVYSFFYGQQPPQMVQSSGSGVIVSNDGYIVTNNHVIQNAEEIEVTLNNNRTYKAELIGSDPSTDLAVLKINEENLPFLYYGNSDNVKIGEWVLAVGNPYNLTSTVTAGIVSAKGRNINILSDDPYTGNSPIESFIQTDAAVNPGNSGGALVNIKGELIGINSAIKSNTGSYTGYSFAIPVNIVKKVVDDLKEYGIVQRAYIGVSISNIDEKISEELDLKDLNGVYVNKTIDGGAANEAGIKKGDIIKKIGAVEIKNVTELQEHIGQFRPGDKINVTVLRNGKEKIIPVVLKNSQGEEKIIEKNTLELTKKLGVLVEEPSKTELKTLGINNGVKVKKIYNGKFLRAGIRPEFIITKVNGKSLKSTEHFYEILKNLKGGVLLEGFYPNGKKAYYGFGV
ncbi:MAG: trypsin-like peptidase domain-containing protein [Vicingaceae bacterium]